MHALGFSDFVVSTVIEGALELLEQPGVWTSGAQARDGSGAVVMPRRLRFCSSPITTPNWLYWCAKDERNS